MSLRASLTAKLYSFSFLDNFILIYPLYAVMFADVGLSPLQISSLFIVWSLSGFILELPAGSIADTYPRKNVLLAGVAFKIAAFLLWIFVKTYWGFLVGFILWGAKVAFTSGTREAMVYDELRRIKKLPSYTKVMGRMEAFAQAGFILAGLGAGLLATHGYNLILWLSILAVVGSGLSLLFLPSASPKTEAVDSHYLYYLKLGLAEIKRQPIVLYIVLLTGVAGGLAIVDEYFGLFFREKGWSNTGLAVWIAIIYTVGIVGSLLAHRLEQRKLRLEALLVVWAIFLATASVAPKILAPVLISLYVVIFFAQRVLLNSYLQAHIGDEARATTTSVGGVATESLALLGFGTMSLGAHFGSYARGFQLIALVVVICVFGLALFAKKYKIDS